MVGGWGLHMASWGLAVPTACVTGYIKTGRYLVGGCASLSGSVYSDVKILSSWLMGRQAQR